MIFCSSYFLSPKNVGKEMMCSRVKPDKEQRYAYRKWNMTKQKCNTKIDWTRRWYKEDKYGEKEKKQKKMAI